MVRSYHPGSQSGAKASDFKSPTEALEIGREWHSDAHTTGHFGECGGCGSELNGEGDCPTEYCSYDN